MAIGRVETREDDEYKEDEAYDDEEWDMYDDCAKEASNGADGQRPRTRLSTATCPPAACMLLWVLTQSRRCKRGGWAWSAGFCSAEQLHDVSLFVVIQVVASSSSLLTALSSLSVSCASPSSSFR